MSEPTALERALQLIEDGTLTIDGRGRIWRHAVISHGIRRAVTARRAESKGGKGYLRVMLQIDGRLRGVGAHRLIWTHLHGSIPPAMQINHMDLDKQNNAPENLEVVTGAQNIQHSYANGRPAPWNAATEWRGRQRITQEQVAEAKRLRTNGMTLREVAQRLAISITHTARITA